MCKVRHYLDSHEGLVVIDHPLGDTLLNKDATKHIAKQAVELGAIQIEFTPQNSFKSQALADFMVEWIGIQQQASTSKPEHWAMYFHGLLRGVADRVLLILPFRKHLKYVLQFL